MAPLDDTNYVARDFVAPHPARPATDEVLVKAREWLSDPARWWRKDFTPVGCSRLQEAPATCAWGACMRAAGQREAHQSESPFSSGAVRLLAATLTGTNNPLDVSDFNDDPSTTHADVLALFDRAIASRKESSR